MSLTEFLGAPVTQRDIERTEFFLADGLNHATARICFSYDNVDTTTSILKTGDLIEFEGYEGKPILIGSVNAWNSNSSSFQANINNFDNMTPTNYGFNHVDFDLGTKIIYVGTLDLDFNDLIDRQITINSSLTTFLLTGPVSDINNNWMGFYIESRNKPTYMSISGSPFFIHPILRAQPSSSNRTALYFNTDDYSSAAYGWFAGNTSGSINLFHTKEEMDQNHLDIKNSLFLVEPDYVNNAIKVESSYEGLSSRNILRNYVFPGDSFQVDGISATVFTVEETDDGAATLIYIEEPIDSYTFSDGASLYFDPNIVLPGWIHIHDLAPITLENYTAYPLTGETADIPIGNTITITATDASNNTATATTLANEQGTWDVVLDLSALDNGDITFRAEAEDEFGDVVYEELVGQKDIEITEFEFQYYQREGAPGALKISSVDGNHRVFLQDNPTSQLNVGDTYITRDTVFTIVEITSPGGVIVDINPYLAGFTWGDVCTYVGTVDTSVRPDIYVSHAIDPGYQRVYLSAVGVINPKILSLFFSDGDYVSFAGNSGVLEVTQVRHDTHNEYTNSIGLVFHANFNQLIIPTPLPEVGTAIHLATEEGYNAFANTLKNTLVVTDFGSSYITVDSVEHNQNHILEYYVNTGDVFSAGNGVVFTVESVNVGSNFINVSQDPVSQNIQVGSTLNFDIDIQNGLITIDALSSVVIENESAWTITGTTEHIAEGAVVDIQAMDSQAGTVTGSAVVGADGTWSATLDVSMLTDGELTIDVVVNDQLGAQQTATSTTKKDTIPSGVLTLDNLIEIDYNNDTTYLISGNSEDLPEGYEVNVIIEDDNGGMVAGVVLIAGDGSWEAEIDVSELGDGAIYVNANTTDQRGDLVSAQGDTVKDSRLPGSITITDVPELISKDNVNQVVISGTTTNTPENNVVNVEIGDGTDTIFATASVQADGSWSATLDVESLTDGILTITADIDDQRGDMQVTGMQVEKDALWPGSISISIGSTSDISAVVVSGTTEWVDAGSTVSLDVLDGAGTTHSFSAITDDEGDYQSTLNLAAIADGTFTITARAVDETGEVVEASAQAQKRTSVEQGGEIYLSAEDIGKHNVEAFSVWGSTVNVPTGQSVTILAEDATGKAISTTASASSTGEYSATLNASSLADGTLTIVATTTDEIGGSISASTQIEKDALHPGTISVSAEDVGKHNVSALVVSGETINTPEGSVVSITATDAEGLIATAEAEVQEDGTYEATLDLNALADGELVIVATVEDETEAMISGSSTILKDALHPGEITIEAPTVGKYNVNAVEVFGSLLNVPTGSEVWVTAEDSAGSQVSGYTLSEADSYVLEIDVYGLADGTLTITATTTDETGAEITTSTQVEKDALHPGTISVSMVEVTYHNYNNVQLTGTTVNVYAGQQVSIDITDHLGNSVSDTATVQDDGTFIRSLDLTELADGTLTASVSVMDETEEVISASTQVSKETVSQDDFTLSNLQTHYGRNFPTGITEGQFAIAKNHTLNYVRTFLNAAMLEYDMTVYAYIKEAVWDIAHYKLWLNVGTPSEAVTQKNERAIEWLKDIAKGNVRVKLPEKESRKKGLHTIMLLR